jgi:hypothetical protein
MDYNPTFIDIEEIKLSNENLVPPVEHYVTLFDQLFLPQALVLIGSLKRWSENFQLWVIAMDSETVRILNEIDEPRIRIIPVEDLETDELRKVRPTRTKGEYCWTLTPFTHTAVFELDKSVERVTYIDADISLLKSPKPIFAEFEESGAAVLITKHAYSPEFDMSLTSGKYCVQFMTFNRRASKPISSWWQDRCVEWCFSRLEEGKFGDQKYLDDWTERFKGMVHVLKNPEWAMGPWNAQRFPYSSAIFYHFHGLRTVRGHGIQNFGISPPAPTWTNVYLPYIHEVLGAMAALKNLDWVHTPQAKKRGMIRIIGSLVKSYVNSRLAMFKGLLAHQHEFN